MAKTRRHPTTIAEPKASMAAGRPRVRPDLAAKLLIAILLLFFAFYIPVLTIRRVQSEMIMKRTLALIRHVPDSRVPEIDLRRAINLDPYNTAAVANLADFLIRMEKQRIERGEDLALTPGKLEEATVLLDKSLKALPSPKIRRRKAEVESILSGVYTRKGDAAAARRSTQAAFDDYFLTGKLLPQPRQGNEAFNAAAMMNAQEIDRADVALKYLHQMDRLRQRYYIDNMRLHPRVERIWLSTGLLAHQARELRYALEKNPHEVRTLATIGRSANDLGMDQMMEMLLEDFDRRGLLAEEGKRVLRWIKGEPVVSANDASTTPTEAQPDL